MSEQQAGPWVLLEGSNGSFLISNQAGLNPPISIDFGNANKTRRTVATRDAWTIVAALNARDGSSKAATATSKTMNWEAVADRMLSDARSLKDCDKPTASLLFMISYALRDGLDPPTE